MDIIINNTSVGQIKEYIISKTSFGKILLKVKPGEVVLDKRSYLNQLSELIISLRNNYSGLRDKIKYDDNILCYTPSSVGENNNMDITEFIFNNSIQHHYNIINFEQNIPLNIPVHNFNLNIRDKEYSIEDCIKVYLNGVEIIEKYKHNLNKYMKGELKTFKDAINKLKIYNQGLYEALSCIYSRVYYYIFLYDKLYKSSGINLGNSFIINNIISEISKLNLAVLQFIKRFINENIFVESAHLSSDITKMSRYIRINKNIPTFTLQQVHTVYNSDKKDMLLQLIGKVLFSDPRTMMPKYSKQIESIITRYVRDDKIFYALNTLLPQQIEEYDRTIARLKQIESVIESKVFKENNKKGMVYLDYGGGNGEITSAIAKRINSKKENSYCMDVMSWYENERESLYDNISYKYINTNKIHLDTESVRFITCFQVLHHITGYQEVLDEFYRILAPGGLIIIREHDCEDYLDDALIDIEHSLYETTIKRKTEDENRKYLNGYEAYYMNKEELRTALLSKGFKEITKDINSKLSIPAKATRYYYTVFTK
jgi:ubiquinone/menaquinone biosynthesis C-methylase UbiE